MRRRPEGQQFAPPRSVLFQRAHITFSFSGPPLRLIAPGPLFLRRHSVQLEILMCTDWTRAEVAEIYHQALPDLIFQAQSTHRQFHSVNEIQMCRLLSIKTGGCAEDCAYCPQSAHYRTGIERTPIIDPTEVRISAVNAKAEGATRFCMGAAWRQVPEGREFESVLESVRAVADLGLEVCCTLGMLTKSQAQRLKQ